MTCLPASFTSQTCKLFNSCSTGSNNPAAPNHEGCRPQRTSWPSEIVPFLLSAQEADKPNVGVDGPQLRQSRKAGCQHRAYANVPTPSHAQPGTAWRLGPD